MSLPGCRQTDPVPGTGTIGDESGVDFYNVVITGPLTIITTADDNAEVCPDLCRFTTPELTTGFYTIQVSAVDRATNEALPRTADFRAGLLSVAQNLRAVDPVFGNTFDIRTPTFQWEPPAVLPTLGIKTFNVAISGTGDAPGTTVVSGDVEQVGTFQCFIDVGTTGDCFVQNQFNTADVTVVQFTAAQLLDDGEYEIRVRVVDNNLEIAEVFCGAYLYRGHRASWRARAGGP